jgi:hypothetical protein
MQEVETFGRRFAIGLSFAGNDRDFVEPLATALKARFGNDRVFDFLSRQPELVGPNGLPRLLQIYCDQCVLVVPVFSTHYKSKQWCRSEWEGIWKALQGDHLERLIPIEKEKAEIEGWGDGDISISTKDQSFEQLANLLYEAYQCRVEKYRSLFSAKNSDQAGLHANPMKEFRNANDALIDTKLRKNLVLTLRQEPLRKLVLQANGNAPDMTAEKLADEILAVVPAKRRAGERWSPLCFVYNTVESIDAGESDPTIIREPAVLDGLERLTSLLLPVSVQDVRSEDRQRVVDSLPEIVHVAGTERMVGASIVGRLLGLQVWLKSDGTTTVRNAVHPNREKPQIPLSGIGGKGLVDAVREELAEILMSRSSRLQDVQAALIGWAGRQAYLCLWLMDSAAESQVGELRALFPQLILLVCDGTPEGDVNPQVLYRLQQIENFIARHREQRT